MIVSHASIFKIQVNCLEEMRAIIIFHFFHFYYYYYIIIIITLLLYYYYYYYYTVHFECQDQLLFPIYFEVRRKIFYFSITQMRKVQRKTLRIIYKFFLQCEHQFFLSWTCFFCGLRPFFILSNVQYTLFLLQIDFFFLKCTCSKKVPKC